MKFFSDEAGRNPIRTGGADVTSAPFANTTLTSVYVEKAWTGFDYAVQDTTLQLQQTNDTKAADDIDYRDPSNSKSAEVKWADSDIAVSSITFPAGTEASMMHNSFQNLPAYRVFTNLPTYDANGTPIYYRVIETAPSGNEAVATSYPVCAYPIDVLPTSDMVQPVLDWMDAKGYLTQALTFDEQTGDFVVG